MADPIKVDTLDVDEETFLFAIKNGTFSGISVTQNGGAKTTASFYRLKIGAVILEGNLNQITFAGVPFVKIFVSDAVLHRIEVQDLATLKVTVNSVRNELVEALSMILSAHDPRIAVDIFGKNNIKTWRVALSKGPSRKMTTRERSALFKSATDIGKESFLEFPLNTGASKLAFVKRLLDDADNSANTAVLRIKKHAQDSGNLLTRYASLISQKATTAVLHLIDVSTDWDRTTKSKSRLMYLVTDIGIKETSKCATATAKTRDPADACVRVNVRIIQQEKRWIPGGNLLAVIDQRTIRLQVVPADLTATEQSFAVRFTKDLINVLSSDRYEVTTLDLKPCKPLNVLQCWDTDTFLMQAKGPFAEGFKIMPNKRSADDRVIGINFPQLLWEGRTVAVSTPSIKQQRTASITRAKEGIADTLVESIVLDVPPTDRDYINTVTSLLRTKSMEAQPLANIYWYLRRVIEAIGLDTSPFSDLDLIPLRQRLADEFGFEVEEPRTQMAIFMVTNEVNLKLRPQYQNSKIAVEVPLLNRLLFFVSRLDNFKNKFLTEDLWTVTVWVCTKIYLSLDTVRVSPLAVERARSDLSTIGAFFLKSRSSSTGENDEGLIFGLEPDELMGSIWSTMLTGAFDLIKPYLFIDDITSATGQGLSPKDSLTDSEEEVRGELFISYLTNTLNSQSPALQQTQEQQENMQLLKLAQQGRLMATTTVPV